MARRRRYDPLHDPELRKPAQDEIWLCRTCGARNSNAESKNCRNCGRDWVGRDGPIPESARRP